MRKIYLFMFILILSIFSVVADATPDTDGDGDGYYDVSNCNQLQNMSQDLTRNYELLNDINCSDTINWNAGNGFLPLGSYPSSPFAGNFTGRGYSIDHLYINDTSGNLKGFIASVSGFIKNVTFDNYTFHGPSFSGAVFGTGQATVVTDRVILNNSYFRCAGSTCSAFAGAPITDNWILNNSKILNSRVKHDADGHLLLGTRQSLISVVAHNVEVSNVNVTDGSSMGFASLSGAVIDFNNINISGNLTVGSVGGGVLGISLNDGTISNVNINTNLNGRDVQAFSSQLLDVTVSNVNIDSQIIGDRDNAFFTSLIENSKLYNISIQGSSNCTEARCGGFFSSTASGAFPPTESFELTNASINVTNLGNSTYGEFSYGGGHILANLTNVYVAPTVGEFHVMHDTFSMKFDYIDRVLPNNVTFNDTSSYNLPTQLTYTGTSQGQIIDQTLYPQISVPGVYVIEVSTNVGDYNLTFNTTLIPGLQVVQVSLPTNTTTSQGNTFNYASRVTCVYTDCGLVNISLLANTSVISDISGTPPFSVDITNPYLVSLTNNSFVQFNYTVRTNRNGPTYYDLATYAEIVSSPSINNQTVNFGVTILQTFNLVVAEVGSTFVKFVWS